MKICSKCGETNGDSLNNCWKCNNILPGTIVNKRCLMCGEITKSINKTCPRCNGKLVDASETPAMYNNETETCMYIVAILFPIIGIILGCIQINNNRNGKTLIITSIVVFFVSIFLYPILFSN